MDDYAFNSHIKAGRAIEAGIFTDQILPVSLPTGSVFAVDQGVRRPPDRERMRALKPVFKEDGRVTAGNSSQVSDAAAALLIASASAVGRYNLSPLARIVARVAVGSDPTLMLDGPIPATPKVLKRAGLTLADMDVIEINEAFASMILPLAKGIASRHEQGQPERRRHRTRASARRDRRGADDKTGLRITAHPGALWLAGHVHRSRHVHGDGDREALK